jgi:transposase
MPRTHIPYTPEYRRRIIELARTGHPIAQLAREFEASAIAIRKWVKHLVGYSAFFVRRHTLPPAQRASLYDSEHEISDTLRSQTPRFEQATNLIKDGTGQTVLPQQMAKAQNGGLIVVMRPMTESEYIRHFIEPSREACH